MIPFLKPSDLPDTKDSSLVHLAPGEMPGRAHSAGTIYVVQQGPVDQDPLTVTEWDLASSKALRSVALPFPSGSLEVRLIRAGDRLHLMIWLPGGDMTYVRISSALTIESVDHIGRSTAHRNDAMASDEALTILVAEVALDSEVHVGGDAPKIERRVIEYDAEGRRIATRTIPKRLSIMPNNAVVIGGKAYILVYDDESLSDPWPKVLELNRDLNIARSITVHAPSEKIDGEMMPFYSYLQMFSWGDHFIVDSQSPPVLIDLAASGREVRRLPRCQAGIASVNTTPASALSDVWLGDVHVALYAGGRARAWLAWAEPGAAGPHPAPPCPNPNAL